MNITSLASTTHSERAARKRSVAATRPDSQNKGADGPAESFSPGETDRPGFLKRVGKKIAKVGARVAGTLDTVDEAVTRLAFAAVPGLAGIALQAASDLVEKVPGRGADKAGKKLESLAARSKRVSLGHLAAMGSGIVEKKFGPDISELKRFERTLADQLKPVDGELPAYLEELRTGQLREDAPEALSPFAPFPAYVHLEGRPEAARELVRRFHHTPAPQESNPYAGTDLETAWTSLASHRENGQLPVFVDLDGKPGEVSPTEKIAAGMVGSLQDRGSAGDEFSSTLGLLESTHQRLEANKAVDDWMKKHRSQVWRTVDNVRKLILPMETGLMEDSLGLAAAGFNVAAPNGLQWRSDPAKLDTAYRSLLLPLAQAAESGKAEEQTRWVDTVAGLDRSLHNGLQTNWMRLSKEISPEQRQKLFRPLVTSWLDLSLSVDQSSSHVIPDSGLSVPHNDKVGKAEFMVSEPYNRAKAAGVAIDHLLDGAGIDERKQLLAIIDEEVMSRDGKAREFVQKNKLNGVTSLPTPAQILRGERRAVLGSSNTQAYDSLQTFLSQRSERFYDPSEALSPELSGVSEFYSPENKVPESVEKVMHLLETQPPGGTPLTETFGEGERTTKTSMVFAGGGGKGMVYTHQLKHLTEQLSASKDGKFEVDEIVGTSAGAITAGLLAAGFSSQELDVIMKEIDFSSFYSDYLGKQGGIDPTARGLDRSGIFSMRSMYETLSGLLSKKLGVEGRPVTFADLKPNLKIVSRLTTTDLPEDSDLKQSADADGKFVFSKENTPHMDVAAALIASSAIPAFFHPPQMMVTGPDGEPRRMQFTDGGVLDNFAVSEASTEEKSLLAVIPNPSADILTTDFAPPQEQLDAAHAMGDQLFESQIASSIVPKVHLLEDVLGAGRVVFGMHLVRNLEGNGDVTFQGQTRSDTEEIYKHIEPPAHVKGDSFLSTEFMVGHWMDGILTGKKSKLLRGLAGLTNRGGIQEHEVNGPENVLLSTVKGMLSSPKERFQTA